MDLAIETKSLTKYYGRVRGCQEITLAVPAGRTFGSLGPNGAGKSTLVKLLAGLLLPTAGSGAIFGVPLGQTESRRLLGFLPEHYRLPDWPRAAELLQHYGRLCGLRGETLHERCRAVLQQVGLAEAAQRRVGGFSNGMKQRLALGAALLHRPRVLLLDEPTAALDPLGRRFVRNLLQELRDAGTTILINSHILSEVERVCDEVAIIREGTVVAAGSLHELTGVRLAVTVRAEPRAAAQTALVAFGPVAPLAAGRLQLQMNDPDQLPAVAEALLAAGARLYELTPRTRSLEDLFVELVAPPGEEAGAGE